LDTDTTQPVDGLLGCLRLHAEEVADRVLG
jgi:hypothetical protein